ncbi:MAG: ABC transporter ATP-binding protein, partial [Rikenellaceae bacterium]
RKDSNVYTDLNFSLKEGGLTTLLGANGAGKSTLMKTLCGVIEPLSGKVLIGGREISSFSKAELSCRVAVVLTERVPDGGLTVFEVVSMGRYPYTGFFGGLTAYDREVVEEAMSVIGIDSMRNKPMAHLSDGERQKVMIAKSISQESDIIILDEPTAFLDVRSKIEIVMLLRNLALEKGKTFLMSSHDIELALQYSDNLWVMNSNGRGMECGSTESVILSKGLEPLVGGSSHFSFDYQNGTFRATNNGEKRVFVKGSDVHWVKNALERVGYTIDGPCCNFVVDVEDYQHIKIGDSTFGSIDDMLQFLIKDRALSCPTQR